MIHRNLNLFAVVTVLLVFATIARADDPTEYTDKTGAFTIKANADWSKRAPRVAAKAVMVLAMEFVGNNDSKLHPIFDVVAIDSSATIDTVAQAMVNGARKRVPNQCDYGKITSTKVDGEDARLVITKDINNKLPDITKRIVTKHNGKVYLIEFFTSDDQYSKQVTLADALFDSFHWK